MAEAITDDWLRSHGFKWHEIARDSKKHWLLWVGDCLPGKGDRRFSHDDFGVELAQCSQQDYWYIWFRADYGGNYSRLLCAGHVVGIDQVESTIAGIIGRPVDWADVMYGCLLRPDQAQRRRAENERLDLAIARQRQERA